MSNDSELFGLRFAYDPDQPRDDKGRWMDAGVGGEGSHNLPTSLKQLANAKDLGGSTGASLMKDSSGSQFVVKGGASQAHADTEHVANETYRAMGVRAPASRMVEGKLVSAFIPGTPLNELTGQARKDAEMEIRKNFVADALLGNWDVVGLEADNIIVDEHGNPWRVDNGGSMSFRAKGSSKGQLWNAGLLELDSMRKQANAGGKVFGSLTEPEIKFQAQRVLNRRDAILSVNKDPIIKQRLDKLEEMFGDKSPPIPQHDEPLPPAPPAKLNSFHDKTLVGKLEALKAHPAMQGAKFNGMQLKKVALINDSPDHLLIPKSFTIPQQHAVMQAIGNSKSNVKLVVVSKVLAGKKAELGVTKTHQLWNASVTQTEKGIAVAQAKTPAEKKAAEKLTVKAAAPAAFKVGASYEGDPKFAREKVENGSKLFKKLEEGNYKSIYSDVLDHDKKLSDPEKKAVNKWKTSCSEIRASVAGGFEKRDKQAKAFKSACDKAPKFEGITYRGVGHIKPGSEIYAALSTVGSKVELTAPACSSRSSAVATKFSDNVCMLRIAGRTGAAHELTQGFTSEHEVVMRAGAKYRVVGVAHDVEIQSYGKYYKHAVFIDLEELPADEQGVTRVMLSWGLEPGLESWFELSQQQSDLEGRDYRFTELEPETYMTVTWSDEELFKDESEEPSTSR